MASKEQMSDLELGLGLSVSGSSTPAAGANCGLLSFNLTSEDDEAGRGGLQHPTEVGIGFAPTEACSEEERSVVEQQRRDWRTKGRDSREKELLEAHRWSFGSKSAGIRNLAVVPVRYPPQPQVMYVPAIDGLGRPCMIPCWATAVLPVGYRCSGTAGRGVVARQDSTGSSMSGISVRRSGSMPARSMSRSSNCSDACDKSHHIWEKPQTQKAASVLVQVPDEKMASSISTTGITPDSAIPRFESFNPVNKPIMTTKEPDRSPMATKEPERSPLPRMPCVATTGDGPNGKKITGVLYKYNQIEHVSILCVCHGMSFSPAEFVRHAGGTETSNPLRQIVVVPS